jgi:hypothetical protein
MRCLLPAPIASFRYRDYHMLVCAMLCGDGDLVQDTTLAFRHSGHRATTAMCIRLILAG